MGTAWATPNVVVEKTDMVLNHPKFSKKQARKFVEDVNDSWLRPMVEDRIKRHSEVNITKDKDTDHLITATVTVILTKNQVFNCTAVIQLKGYRNKWGTSTYRGTAQNRCPKGDGKEEQDERDQAFDECVYNSLDEAIGGMSQKDTVARTLYYRQKYNKEPPQ